MFQVDALNAIVMPSDMMMSGVALSSDSEMLCREPTIPSTSSR